MEDGEQSKCVGFGNSITENAKKGKKKLFRGFQESKTSGCWHPVEFAFFLFCFCFFICESICFAEHGITQNQFSQCPKLTVPVPSLLTSSSSATSPPPYPFMSYYYPTGFTPITEESLPSSTSSNSFSGFSSSYVPDWGSLDSRPYPRWYDEVKFGVLIHWGVYTVPSNDVIDAEWFWNHAKNGAYPAADYMRKNGIRDYHDFAKDLRADLFDPTEWINLVEEAGAKYVIVTAKHHDGYCLWDSSYSPHWNSVDLQPHRNILHEILSALLRKNIDILSNSSGQLSGNLKEKMQQVAPSFFPETSDHYNNDVYSKKINKQKEEKDLQQFMNSIVSNKMFNKNPYKSVPIRLGLFYSFFEWYNPLYKFDRSNNFESCTFTLSKTIPELYEIIHKFLPSVLWNNGDWEADDKYWRSKEFLAYLYNSSPIRDYIVTNDRWGRSAHARHAGYTTGRHMFHPEFLLARKFEHFLSMDKASFGYRRNANLDDYLSTPVLLEEFASTLAYGGNFLLSVGPSSDGKIAAVQQSKLKEIGHFVRAYQEAIYFTKPWNVAQEEKYDATYKYEANKYDDFYNNTNGEKYNDHCQCKYYHGTTGKTQRIYYVVPAQGHQLFLYDSTHFKFNTQGHTGVNNKYDVPSCLYAKNKLIKNNEDKVVIGNSNGIIYAYFFTWPDDRKIKFKNITVDENTKAFLVDENNNEIPLDIYRKRYAKNESSTSNNMRSSNNNNEAKTQYTNDGDDEVKAFVVLPCIAVESSLAKRHSWLIKFVYLCGN